MVNEQWCYITHQATYFMVVPWLSPISHSGVDVQEEKLNALQAIHQTEVSLIISTQTDLLPNSLH